MRYTRRITKFYKEMCQLKVNNIMPVINCMDRSISLIGFKLLSFWFSEISYCKEALLGWFNIVLSMLSCYIQCNCKPLEPLICFRNSYEFFNLKMGNLKVKIFHNDKSWCGRSWFMGFTLQFLNDQRTWLLRMNKFYESANVSNGSLLSIGWGYEYLFNRAQTVFLDSMH